jgi:tRNA A37 N6-isopentenylltransferase MiaA
LPSAYYKVKSQRQNHRAALCDRIEQRGNTMLDRGWFEEVAGFVRSSVPDDPKSFDFTECSELRARLEGAVTLTVATKANSQATRRCAKRHLTRFRNELLVHRLPKFEDGVTIASAAEQLAAGHLHFSAAP